MSNRRDLLSVRRGLRKPFELQEGMPPHIWAQLRPLMYDGLGERPDVVGVIAARLMIPVGHGYSPLQDLFGEIAGDEDLILDVLDLYVRFAVALRDPRASQILRDIKFLLGQGHSIWTLNLDEGRVEERVSSEVTAMYESLQSEGGRASELISEAWRCAFGRSPDPSAAWDQCTRALEAALIPIVSPRNTKARYGTVVSNMKDLPEKWDADLTGDTPRERTLAFIDLLEKVPYSPDRHEGSSTVHIPVTLARSIVLITTSILEIVHQKGLRRVEP